jgi:DNA-binding PadR family transcriptional regulator
MAERPSLGQFEQLVLTAILSQGEDAYGVTIHRAVDALMAPRQCQLGAVYATLDRMEDKGLVVSWLSEPTAQRGGRAKRHYRLSPDGEAALSEAAVVAGRLRDAVERQWGGKPWKLA